MAKLGWRGRLAGVRDGSAIGSSRPNLGESPGKSTRGIVRNKFSRSPSRRGFGMGPPLAMIKLAIAGGVLLGLAAWKPEWCSRLLRTAQGVLARLGRRPRLAVLLVFLLSLTINAGLTLAIGKSSPHIHDEFANLLAADTFLHGRLGNVQHPLWPFFEEIHVLASPIYASKYPPAQGLMLALGKLLTGQYIAGMWLSVALACAAIAWALLGWLPARWALLGGLLTTLHPVLLKWGQVYWGGAEAMLGGALLAGALPRLMRGPKIGDSCWLALGMVILALSRPFEGMVLSLLVLGALAVWLLRRRAALAWPAVGRLLLPAGLIMGIYFGWQAFYNARLTGDFFKLPYMVYEERYNPAGFLVFQKGRPNLQYNHDLIRRHFMDYAWRDFQKQKSAGGFVRETLKKIKRLVNDYSAKYALLPAFLALPWLLRRRGWPLFPALATGVFLAVVLLEVWMWDRYVAPVGALFFVVVWQGFRHLSFWRCGGRPFGRALVVVAIIGFLGQSALWVKKRQWEHARRDWDWQRVQMISQLEKQGGKHLILVRYGPKQSVHDDWVHNRADIDNAAVVWARDMGPEKNRELFDYFRGRQVWLLESEMPEAAERDQMKTPPKHELKPYPLP